MAKPTQARIVKERFRGRRASFLRKAKELSDKCGARVYVVICRNGKYYTFNSNAESSWPPPENQIVQQNPIVLPPTQSESDIGIHLGLTSRSPSTAPKPDTVDEPARGKPLSTELKPPVLAKSPIETRNSLRWSGQ